MQHGPYEHIAADAAGPRRHHRGPPRPEQFVDTDMVAEIADALETYDRTPDVRAIVLCAEGKHFCAGADFGCRGLDGIDRGAKPGRHLYKEAQRLWRTDKPIVAAVHGAAIGAGIGLAVMADFRVACPEARFSANFTRLGFHPGFGLTVTLPRLIGMQQAALLMYTGRRISGEEALEIGLVNYCVPPGPGPSKAVELATEIAAIRAAGDRLHPGNPAPRPRRRRRPRHRARIRGTGLAAQHRRLQGGHQGDGRTPPARLPGAIAEKRPHIGPALCYNKAP